jgi:CubicO group peptidase (beta-lactamase class C family)
MVGCDGSASPSSSRGSPVSPSATVDAQALSTAVDTFFERSFAAGKSNVRAVLVSVDGQPVVNRYYRGRTAAETANVASVTKSVVSTLVGIALAEGELDGLDQTLRELLPDYARVMSSETAGITLRQLLTMTAGLPPDGLDGRADPSVGGRDWVRSILTKGTVQPPGQSFAYSSAGSHLLAAIVVEATGQPLLEYAREKLFDPLGIVTRPAVQPLVSSDEGHQDYDRAAFAWPIDPQGINVGFTLLKLTAPDMAKLGSLFVDDGRWNGRQLVPAQWVHEATSPLVPTGDGPGDHYGYQWWTMSAAGHPAFAAFGFGGQIIEVVPDLRLVVTASTVISEDVVFDATTFEFLTSTVIAPAIS